MTTKDTQRSPLLAVLIGGLVFSALAQRATTQEGPIFGKPTDPDQPGIRWVYPDDNTFWMPEDVAIGDRGAAAFCALGTNADQDLLFAAGRSRPAFRVDPEPVFQVLRMYADMAEHGSLAAAVVLQQVTATPDAWIVPKLTAYEHAGGGAALWSVDLPGSKAYADKGLGVRVSRDSEVVVAWWAVTGPTGLHVEAFHGDGTPLSSTVLYEDAGYIPGLADTADFSDDLSRAVFSEAITKKVVILDIASGATELVYKNGLAESAGPNAMSGDGLRFASTANSHLGNTLLVWERDPSGTWSVIRQLPYPADGGFLKVAMDRTGNRVAFAIGDNSQEGFQILLYDLASDSILFDHTFDAPGTTLANIVSDLCMDDDGRTVAGSTWGDSLNLTPEVFVFDEGGKLLRAIDTGGSCYTVDITPEGDLVIAGSKRTHASMLGPGGDLILIETRTMQLHVSGLPAIGTALDLTIEGGQPGDLAYVAVAGSLLDQPPGAILLDLSGPSVVLPPVVLDGDGRSEQAFHVPSTPALVGLELHAQAFIVGASAGATNQVSLRLLPPADS